MSERVYVAGNHGGKAHIAHHPPSGYGVWSLCGKSWNEGWFSVVDASAPMRLCLKCEQLAKQEERTS